MTTATTDLEHAARLFHALSDVRRLEVLQRLQGGERCVCDLTDAMDAGQSLLSFHLKTLREAGLVTARRQGRWMYYGVAPDALHEVETMLAGLRPRASLPVVGCCG